MDRKEFTDFYKQIIEETKAYIKPGQKGINAEIFLLVVLEKYLEKSDTVLKSRFHDDEYLSYKMIKDFCSKKCIDIVVLKNMFISLAKDTVTSFSKVYFYSTVDKVRKEPGEYVTLNRVLFYLFNEPCSSLKNIYNLFDSELSSREACDNFDALFNNQDFAELRKQNVQIGEIELKNRISELTTRTKEMQKKLSEKVIGQDNAVNVFCSGYFQSELTALTDPNRKRPKATFLFAGPPGVGKTYLAETVAKEVLGLPFARFDMSEYCHHESALEFIGSDNVYKNAKRGNFTSFVDDNPKCVVLFDEIEKADPSIILLFLQILDAGIIRDSKTDKEIPLKDTILIFTTNAGKQLYENSEQSNFSNISRKVILKALQTDIDPVKKSPYFPPAICSRFATGNVVMFNHLNASNLIQMTEMAMSSQIRNLNKQTGIDVVIKENVSASLIFSEGGNIDGRTASARAVTFINEELFELFRLIASDRIDSEIPDIEKIVIKTDLSGSSRAIKELFSYKQKGDEKPDVILFASEEIESKLNSTYNDCSFIRIDSKDVIPSLITEHDIKFAIIDIDPCSYEDKGYLNIEDEDSPARDALWLLVEQYPDLPIYLLQREEHSFNDEEMNSFIGLGVQGLLDLNPKVSKKALKEICIAIHQQESISYLGRTNKIISYETRQQLSSDGKTAEICLFDYELKTAVDSEDSSTVLSTISTPNVKFSEIIGAEDAKEELRYFSEYLKNPKVYISTGVGAPKGVILYGPPGTGKTMLAKAMASEAGVSFISKEGNNFIHGGPEMVHDLFKIARKYAPSVLFIDEIDAIAKERTGNKLYVEDTLTAFLTEMDGFTSNPTKPVFILAATNFDVEPGSSKSLDQALMRRFDRRIFVDLPNQKERLTFMKKMVHDKKMTFDVSDAKLKNIAIRSAGMSLAELESVFELARRSVIRKNKVNVNDEILEDSFETFNSGEIKKWSEEELLNTARHEAGHAFVSWYSGDTPSYVTIVSRGNYGGYVSHKVDETKMTYSKNDLLNRIKCALAGRAAELVYYGPENGLTSGASSDLVSATKMAQRIICSLGMDEGFGLAVVDMQAANLFELSSEVRDAVNRILKEQMDEAIKLISENRDAIDALVKVLMSETHLSGEEMDKVLKPFRK